DHGTELRPAAGRDRLARVMPIEDLDRIMITLVAYERADDDEFVHHLCQARECLADLDARDVGGDGPPWAGNLLGRLGLEVEHVLVWWPAHKVNKNDRLVRRVDTRGILGPKQLR